VQVGLDVRFVDDKITYTKILKTLSQHNLYFIIFD